METISEFVARRHSEFLAERATLTSRICVAIGQVGDFETAGELLETVGSMSDMLTYPATNRLPELVKRDGLTRLSNAEFSV
jgi:hypothetical protein